MVDLRGREVVGKMVMQIDRIDEKSRNTISTNIGWRKDNKRQLAPFLFSNSR